MFGLTFESEETYMKSPDADVRDCGTKKHVLFPAMFFSAIHFFLSIVTSPMNLSSLGKILHTEHQYGHY